MNKKIKTNCEIENIQQHQRKESTDQRMREGEKKKGAKRRAERTERIITYVKLS